MDRHPGDLVDAVLAVDRVGGLERPRRQGTGDQERLHDGAGLEPIGHGAVAARVGIARGVVVWVVTGHAREGEDLPALRVDDDEGAALRLVRAHAASSLSLGDVLDPFVDREDDVVPCEGVGVVGAVENEAPASIAQAVDLFHLPAQVVV